MFGEKVDYLLLRTVADRRNQATEAELQRRADQVSSQSLEEVLPRLQQHIERFEGRFPLRSDLRYLDMGCGTGEVTIALARLGCGHITGVDFVPRNIAKGESYARQLGITPTVSFICADMNAWMPAEKYDVLVSFAAFEHIDTPRAFLARMANFLAPNGIAVLAFGPLFHSPFGDHMWDFFRVQIPWRGILFSEKAILRLRQECFRPTDPANRYQEIVGGLNLMRYSEFLTYVHETGWEFNFLSVNTFLRRWAPLSSLSNALTQIPGARDYFAHNVYAILRRRSS